MRYLVAVFFTLLIVACGGYKPAPQYANDIFAEPVLVKVKMDPEDPDAGVFLQDEIAKMAVNRLNLTLTKNVNLAKSYIVVNSYTINTTPLNYDENGNIIRYSVNAAIEFAIKDKFGFWSKNIVASEYVDVKPEATTSALDKEKAGKVAIQKALDTFVVAVMQRSRKVGKDKAEVEDKKAKYEESVQETTTTVTNAKTIPEETTTQSTNVFAQSSQYEQTESFDINIVPTDSDTPLQDATVYK